MVIFRKVTHKISLFNVITGVLLYIGLSAHICNAGEISFVVNPNCPSETTNCSKPWIIYGKQANANFTVHYLWSAVNIPSFVMAYSFPDVEIEINWSDFTAGIPGSISFSEAPETVFGISFQTLILFNDVNDTGILDNIPEADKKYAYLSEFEWAVDSSKNITGEECTFSFYSTTFREKPLSNNTKISFSVTSYGTSGRSSELPHLLKTPYSAHMEVVLDNLVIDLDSTYSSGHHHTKDDVVPISGFDHPRWALDTIIVSDDQPSEGERGFMYENKKSLDDEYTPGVFDLTSITTEGARKSFASPSLGGYLQWRPVCYLTADKDINDSTFPNFNTSLPSSIDDKHKENATGSLFYVLFGNQIGNLVGTQTPIAFGQSKDEFYTKFNYTEWTFAMGLGGVPEENFSTVIIIVISVAVGIPCTLFIAGGMFLLIRKMRRREEMQLIDEPNE